MAFASTMVRRMRTAATQSDYKDSIVAGQNALMLPLAVHTSQARLLSARNACRDFRIDQTIFPTTLAYTRMAG